MRPDFFPLTNSEIFIFLYPDLPPQPLRMTHQSREFFDLVKAIGECRSKQEEDKIIESEMTTLKSRFSDPTNLQNPRKLREFLVRAIYVEMLGHDASTFAYIHGVNLSHNKNLTAKRVGYLVSCLFLDPKHSELMLLLINTIQKDLRSSNLLEVSFALVVVSRLANVEMAPVLVPLVTPLLAHQSEMIRRRAVIGFHRLVQIGSDISPQTIHQVMRKSLCDSDPGVMSVGLNLLFDLSAVDADACEDLVPSIVGILKQVIDHRLPRDFDYHRMPAPWIQIRLVALLARLGRGNEEASVLMYDAIGETMRRADMGSNAGAAVAFECIKCAAAIAPNHTLLEHASLLVSKFIASDNQNYKYIGITGLSQIAAINPVYATEHQLLVVECLDDSDDTLRRKTVELLCQMTNPNNVTVVVEKILSQLDDSSDSDAVFKRDLVGKLCEICQRFAPSNEWYLLTINQVFSKCGAVDLVPESVGENLTRLVAEQDGPDEQSGADLRIVAANEYVGWLERYVGKSEGPMSVQFLKLVVWMLGEFASLADLDTYTLDDIVDLLIESARALAGKEPNNPVVGYMVTAIAKNAVIASGVSKQSAVALFQSLVVSASPEVARRCKEYLFVFRQAENVQRALLPFDAACEDIELDLRFLDSFCAKARSAGAREYARPAPVPKSASSASTAGTVLTGLRFEAYKAPQPVSTMPLPSVKPSIAVPEQVSAVPLTSPPPSQPQLTAVGGKRWGPQGFNGVAKAAAPPVQAASAPAPALKTPSVSSASVASVATPSLTKEYLEKQRMAAALFSGVPHQGKAASVASKPGPAKKSPAVQNLAAAADLLDLGNSPSLIPVPAPAVALETEKTMSSDFSDDLLGLS